MNKSRFDKYIAEMTKEIVIANLQGSGVVPSEMSGSDVSDFYRNIYNGLSETLKDTGIVED